MGRTLQSLKESILSSSNFFSSLYNNLSFFAFGVWNLVYGMEEALYRHRRNYYGPESLLQMESSLSLSLQLQRMGIPSLFASVSLLILCIIFSEGLVTVQAFTGTYGINYGRLADNIPPPESVVTLLKAAKLKNVRIYDADPSVLQAFKGSGLELVVTIPNEILKDMSVSEDRAMSWVKENVQAFLPDTHIRGISIGNEILGLTDLEIQESLVGAVKNVYKAVDRLQLKDLVEVSTPHSQAVFANSFPPSSCTFNDNIIQYMKPLLEFFSQTGAPFYINVYPFLAYSNDPKNIDINYALFQSNPGIHDAKTNLHYDNMFDAQIDAAYAALEAAGFEKMEVRVSETGWASKGDDEEAGATVHNARTYNYNLRKRLAKRKGTPLRPKIVVKAYVFALFNENSKPGKTSERNFGLFKADGSIAYDIGFTGLKPSAASASLFSLKDIRARGWAGALGPYSITLTMCAAVLFLV
ncbi:glucan endo-1,3-beta-glucosidase 14-like [Magnolia sinica]|uniref:glucan endo-1,3-beta-glucosidase 14-like n=1 Tax=Magnolia sinica TaxID=86752 RepID=UPI002657FEDF|nr:glucan endo-1,3-beta-glucosidase 14-like [Magnolia sinica]